MVIISIEISSRTQELIRAFERACAFVNEESPLVLTSMDLHSLYSWFDDKVLITQSSDKAQQDLEFILLCLRTELLHDLGTSLLGESAINKEENNRSTYDQIKFALLAIAGILVAACEGFDCIVTMMSIFALPSAVIFTSGFIFSFLSIITFCGLELVKLSHSLEVKLGDAHKLLDVYLQQLNEIKQIRKKIANYNFSELSVEELQQLVLIIGLLQQRFLQLADASIQFDRVLHSRQMQLAQAVLSAIAALLFFGGSFCAAQTASLYIFGLFMTAVTPASLPVMLLSILVGSAALSLYWYVEFPGIKSLVGDWFGLDEAQVATLCDSAALKKEEKKLGQIRKKITGTLSLKEQLAQTRDNFFVSAEDVVIDEPQSRIFKDAAIRVSTNIYSFTGNMNSRLTRTAECSVEFDDMKMSSKC